MGKTALITGINGQVGPYLAQYLESLGYKTFGMVRQSSQSTLGFLSEFGLKTDIVQGDLTDDSSLQKMIRSIKPDECYNLAAASHPGLSFDQPEMTVDITGVGVLRLLEQIRWNSPQTRFCQISSADIFANTNISPQTENTPFAPNSPYGAAKIFAHNMVDLYRQSYGLYAVNLIAYNHESPRRSNKFITKKVVEHFVRQKEKKVSEILKVGNLESFRCWGDVRDFIVGYNSSLQPDIPENYILCGKSACSVFTLITTVCDILNIPISFVGNGNLMRGENKFTKELLVETNLALYRPSEPVLLVGNQQKALEKLGWAPHRELYNTLKWMINSERERHHRKLC